MVGIPKVVVFDCDGVLVDSVSSWKTLHDYFGTDNSLNLQRFINGELTDVEFMRSDIQMWKEIKDPIFRDELFRSYSGVKLMPGAKELIKELKDKGGLIGKTEMSLFATTLHEGEYVTILEDPPYKGKKVKISYGRQKRFIKSPILKLFLKKWQKLLFID